MDWKQRYRALRISEDDISRLEAFVALVEELHHRHYFDKKSISCMVEAGVNSGVEQISDHGDSEDLRSAILSIRKLISEKEPTFVLCEPDRRHTASGRDIHRAA